MKSCRLPPDRYALWLTGLRELEPFPEHFWEGRSGEAIGVDEASVWKRVLNLRLARFLQPSRILETHGGLGVSTFFYRRAAPNAEIVSLSDFKMCRTLSGFFDLIDIDPFGFPYDALDAALPLLAVQGVLLVSNGEAFAVGRNWQNVLYAPTTNVGRRLNRWVKDEYLPRLEALTGLTVRFFYAFPTTVRAVLSRRELPDELWRGCKQWKWYLERYEAYEAASPLF